MDKCKFCKKNVKQFMAHAAGNLTRRFFRCDTCQVVFVEYVFVPYGGNKHNPIILENVIGDTSNLTPFSVFKVTHYKIRKVSEQSSLDNFG